MSSLCMVHGNHTHINANIKPMFQINICDEIKCSLFTSCLMWTSVQFSIRNDSICHNRDILDITSPHLAYKQLINWQSYYLPYAYFILCFMSLKICSFFRLDFFLLYRLKFKFTVYLGYNFNFTVYWSPPRRPSWNY